MEEIARHGRADAYARNDSLSSYGEPGMEVKAKDRIREARSEEMREARRRGHEAELEGHK